MFPTNKITKIADIFDQLIARDHIQSLQTYFKGLSIDAFLHHILHVLFRCFSHQRNLLERFVEVVQIVDLKPIHAVFLDQIRDILCGQKAIFLVQIKEHVFLR